MLDGLPLGSLTKPADEQEYSFVITHGCSIYAKSKDDAHKQIQEKYIPSILPSDFNIEVYEG